MNEQHEFILAPMAAISPCALVIIVVVALVLVVAVLVSNDALFNYESVLRITFS